MERDAAGAIRLRGKLLDGAKEPVPDGLVEIWQTDAHFRGFGRCPTERDGSYEFLTQKPAEVRAPDGAIHAPHVLVSVFARGLLKRVVTRIYFPDEEKANATDPVLALLVDPRRRATLVAARAEGGYIFDIRLQGEGETVFFEP